MLMVVVRGQDQDAIDFTDNDISSLGNFPFFPRLHTLLLARNRVRQIQSNISNSIPSLSTLVLTANNIAELADLDPLRGLTKLTHLVLLENPVTRKEVRITIFFSPRLPPLQHYVIFYGQGITNRCRGRTTASG